MEHIAPPQLAEQWDNCGLQVGSYQWPVRKVWVALDPHPAVIQAAEHQNVDMVVTHHPLLFQPLSSIDVDTPLGGIVQTALTSRIAVYAAHTNLDSTKDGLNDILAVRIGLTEPAPLIPATTMEVTHEQSGMGRIGLLADPMTLEQFALRIKSALNLTVLKMSGDPQLMIRRVALCSGGGSGLLNEFIASDAQVYVSGDLRYHDARAVEDLGRALIDVGHFPSEQIVIDALAQKLRNSVRLAGWSVNVEPCRLERDPFRYI